MIRDGLKRQRLNQLNEGVAELQQAKKWKALREIRGMRRRIAGYYDRLTAKRIAETSSRCIVAIGYPKWIKYENYRGNGKRNLRHLMTRWAYRRIISYVREECAEKGIKAVESNGWRSLMTCHQCGSRNTERLMRSVIHCYNCGLTYNADFNAAINIGSSFLAGSRSRGVQLNPPELRMNQPERLGSAEATCL